MDLPTTHTDPRVFYINDRSRGQATLFIDGCFVLALHYDPSEPAPTLEQTFDAWGD